MLASHFTRIEPALHLYTSLLQSAPLERHGGDSFEPISTNQLTLVIINGTETIALCTTAWKNHVGKRRKKNPENRVQPSVKVTWPFQCQTSWEHGPTRSPQFSAGGGGRARRGRRSSAATVQSMSAYWSQPFA